MKVRYRANFALVIPTTCAVAVFGSPDSHAANSIVIESKIVAPGATGIQIGVYFSNDVTISVNTIFRGQAVPAPCGSSCP